MKTAIRTGLVAIGLMAAVVAMSGCQTGLANDQKAAAATVLLNGAGATEVKPYSGSDAVWAKMPGTSCLVRVRISDANKVTADQVMTPKGERVDLNASGILVLDLVKAINGVTGCSTGTPAALPATV